MAKFNACEKRVNCHRSNYETVSNSENVSPDERKEEVHSNSFLSLPVGTFGYYSLLGLEFPINGETYKIEHYCGEVASLIKLNHWSPNLAAINHYRWLSESSQTDVVDWWISCQKQAQTCVTENKCACMVHSWPTPTTTDLSCVYNAISASIIFSRRLPYKLHRYHYQVSFLIIERWQVVQCTELKPIVLLMMQLQQQIGCGIMLRRHPIRSSTLTWRGDILARPAVRLLTAHPPCTTGRPLRPGAILTRSHRPLDHTVCRNYYTRDVAADRVADRQTDRQSSPARRRSADKASSNTTAESWRALASWCETKIDTTRPTAEN